MPDPTAMTPTVQRLVQYVAGSVAADPLVDDLAAWLAASPRFRSFVDANRDKVRKKLRGATTLDARLDMRAELWVAARIVADRRFELAFEAYGSGRRGPDFTITYRAGRPFNVEVTRRHGSGDVALEPVIIAKLRQLPPSVSNVLVVIVDAERPLPDPSVTLRDLRARADRRDDAFFRTAGLDGSNAFNAGSLRLGAVLAVAPGTDGSARVAHSWNAGARIALPAPTLRALVRALAGTAA